MYKCCEVSVVLDTGVAAYFRCCKAHRLVRSECSRAHFVPHAPCMWVQRICASWQHAMADWDAHVSELQQFMAGAIAQTMNRRTVPSMGKFFISWIQEADGKYIGRKLL